MGNKDAVASQTITEHTISPVNPENSQNAIMFQNISPRAQSLDARAKGYADAARTLEGLARSLRDRALYLEHLSDEAVAWERHRYPSDAEVLATATAIMAEGVLEARAVSLTAKRLAMPYESTVRALGRARRAEKTRERQQRNRRIMQRVALGWTNQAIADAEGMHRQSVARIVSAEKSKARAFHEHR